MVTGVNEWSIINQTIVQKGFQQKYIPLTQIKYEGVWAIIDRSLRAFSERFLSTQESMKNMLSVVGTSYVVLVALSLVNISSESFRLCIKICVTVQILLMGHEAYKKRQNLDDKLPPVTELYRTGWLDFGSMKLREILRWRFFSAKSAENFRESAMRNCTIFGATAEIVSIACLLAFKSPNGLKGIGFTLFGTALGVLTGLLCSVNSIEPATEWSRWKQRAKENEIWSQFQQVVVANLEPFICPIGGELILVPAKMRGEDLTYEKDRAIAKKNGQICDEAPEQKADLVYDPSYFAKIGGAINKLLIQPDEIIPKAIKEGLDAYRITIELESDKLYYDVDDALLGAELRREITPARHLNGQKEYKRYYQVPSLP
jgi:hypothetical protein